MTVGRWLVLVSVVAAVLLGAFSPAAAGPFGLSQGMTKAQVEALGIELTENSLHWYTASTVPKPHKNFESYLLLIDPQTGLAKLAAIGVTLTSNSYGDAVKQRFSTIEEALIKKYGKGQDYDFLRFESIWDEPNDWMMGLKLEERTLVTFWTDGLPDGLQGIKLEANALSSTTGYVNLAYEFTNAAAAMDRITEAENEGF